MRTPSIAATDAACPVCGGPIVAGACGACPVAGLCGGSGHGPVHCAECGWCPPTETFLSRWVRRAIEWFER